MSQDNQAPAAFILGTELPTFDWTVRVPVPGADDYRFAALPLTFQAVDQAELDKMQGRGLAEGELPPSDEQIVRRVVVGWPSLKNDKGAEVPFSPEALGQLLRVPIMRTAIISTYLAVMAGVAARKNV